MRLFGLDISRAKAVSDVDPVKALVSQAISLGFDSSLPVNWTWQTMVNAYKSWVYIATDKIASSVAMLPLELYVYRDVRTGKLVNGRNIKTGLRECKDRLERKMYLKEMQVEKEPVTSHPWLDLMSRPNNVTVRYTLWYDTLVKMELGGACGWYMPRNSLGIPGEIYVLPLTSTAKLKPIPDSVHIIGGYEYEDGTVRQTFATDEIMYMRYPSPKSPLEGMSALKAQTYPYSVDDYIEKLQYYMFKNRAVPGLNLHTDAQLKGQQIEDIKTQIQSTFEGAKNAGKLFVTHSGLKIGEPLTQSFADLLLNDVSTEQQDKLLAAFDVPAGLVGLVKDVNRANMEALKESFYGETIRSKTMLIEEHIEAFMLPLYDERLTCDFRLPDLSQRELDLQERKENLESGLTTINEERFKMGREEVAWGDAPWFPVNRIQYEENPEPRNSKGFVVKNTDDKTLTMAWKAYERQHSSYEKLLLSTARKLFSTQRDEVIKRAVEETERLNGKMHGARKSTREKFTKQNGLFGRVFDVAMWEKKTREVFGPVLDYIWEDAGGEQIKRLSRQKALGGAIQFNINDPHAQLLLGQRLETFSREITGTTFTEVEVILQGAWQEGLSATATSDLLLTMFDKAEKYRAPLIARTEATGASNAADLEAVRQMGLENDLVKFWISSRDLVTRDTHIAAEEKYKNGIPIDQDFSVGADTMQAPGMGSRASENINCRCTLGYKRKGE